MDIYCRSDPVANSEKRVQLIEECLAAAFRSWNFLYPILNELTATDAKIRDQIKTIVEKEQPMKKGRVMSSNPLRLMPHCSDPYFTDQEAMFIQQADDFRLAQRALLIAVCDLSREYSAHYPHLKSKENQAKRQEALSLIDEEFSDRSAALKIFRATSLTQGAKAIEQQKIARQAWQDVEENRDDKTISELATTAGISGSAMHKRIKRLTSNGWLEPRAEREKRYYSPEECKTIRKNPRGRPKKEGLKEG